MTAVVIYLGCAALAIPIGLGIYSDRRSEHVSPTRAFVDLTEIQAGITVYDVVDGREVNRRPAYPMARLTMSFRSMEDPMQRLGGSVRRASEALQKIVPSP